MTTLKDVTLKHNLFLSCLSPSQPSLLGELMCAVNHQSNGRCFDFWLLWPICQSLGQCSSNCVVRMLTVASHGQRCNQHNSTVCWLLQPCDAVIIRVFFHAALKNMTMRKEQQFPVEDKCLHTYRTSSGSCSESGVCLCFIAMAFRVRTRGPHPGPSAFGASVWGLHFWMAVLY